MSPQDAPSGLEIKDPTNPVVKIVTGSERNALTGTATRKWWAIKPADAQVILSASNGDPLVMERPFGTNGGIVDVWASSVDGSWNNWNLVPNFVPLVNETILRSQSQAEYGPDNIGHFGLALTKYAHFTSPIRRYADLLVHRALITGLKLGKDGLSDEDIRQFEDTAEQITKTERRATLAERDSTDRYLALYLQHRVGDGNRRERICTHGHIA